MATRVTRRQFLKRASLVTLAMTLQPWRAVRAAAVRPPSIKFCGAAQFVSGTSHLLDTGRYRVLLDCGLFMEPENEQFNGKFSFDPQQIDLVILSHAHADHVGNLHHLIRQGYRGRIVTTDATRDIFDTVAGNMMDRKGDSRGPSKEDLETIAASFKPVPYNTKIQVVDNLVMRYTDAGHMLGSAFVELWFDETKFVFSGDIGPHDAPILCEPSILQRADYLAIESTYGDVTRKKEDWTRLGTIIRETVERGGSVLIPVFAAEKLQRLIYRIRQLKQAELVPKNIKVISDSSSGNEITEVYRRYADYYDPTAKSLTKPFDFPGFYEMSSRDSLATHGEPGMIYLSTSGMIDHATSPKHLAAMCDDPRNTLIFVGYQSPHTLGGQIYAGDRNVSISWEASDGREEHVRKDIKMRVEKLGGFSGHADGAQLVDWVGNFPKLKQVFVVHGEKTRATDMARQIHDRWGFPAMAPTHFQTINLDRAETVARRGDAPALPQFTEMERYDPQDF